jgi:hypothetical protein
MHAVQRQRQVTKGHQMNTRVAAVLDHMPDVGVAPVELCTSKQSQQLVNMRYSITLTV